MTGREELPSYGLWGYGFWGFGPTGKVHMVSEDVHIFVCHRTDTSDKAHYGKGTWCSLGKGNLRKRVESVLNSESDVLDAEAGLGMD